MLLTFLRSSNWQLLAVQRNKCLGRAAQGLGLPTQHTRHPGASLCAQSCHWTPSGWERSSYGKAIISKTENVGTTHHLTLTYIHMSSQLGATIGIDQGFRSSVVPIRLQMANGGRCHPEHTVIIRKRTLISRENRSFRQTSCVYHFLQASCRQYQAG